MALCSVGWFSDSEVWPQRTQRAQRLGTEISECRGGSRSARMGDEAARLKKYLDEMDKSGFYESLWGRERIRN